MLCAYGKAGGMLKIFFKMAREGRKLAVWLSRKNTQEYLIFEPGHTVRKMNK
jgi:hypothetical protein